MGVESPRGGSSGIPRTGTLAKRHTVNYWNQITVVISGLVDTLQFNNVPPLIIQGILKQLLAFVDMKIFNRFIWKLQLTISCVSVHTLVLFPPNFFLFFPPV